MTSAKAIRESVDRPTSWGLRAYVVDYGDNPERASIYDPAPRLHTSGEVEVVLCEDCAPVREAGWTALRVFFDYVADRDPSFAACADCGRGAS